MSAGPAPVSALVNRWRPTRWTASSSRPLGVDMIRNSQGAYCGVLMVVGENLDHSRSVEHMIPNTVLTQRRTRREGDFYACRGCNSEKSHIDYVLENCERIVAKKDLIGGMEMVERPPFLPHFTAKFAPIDNWIAASCKAAPA